MNEVLGPVHALASNSTFLFAQITDPFCLVPSAADRDETLCRWLLIGRGTGKRGKPGEVYAKEWEWGTWERSEATYDLARQPTPLSVNV